MSEVIRLQELLDAAIQENGIGIYERCRKYVDSTVAHMKKDYEKQESILEEDSFILARIEAHMHFDLSILIEKIYNLNKESQKL